MSSKMVASCCSRGDRRGAGGAAVIPAAGTPRRVRASGAARSPGCGPPATLPPGASCPGVIGLCPQDGDIRQPRPLRPAGIPPNRRRLAAEDQRLLGCRERRGRVRFAQRAFRRPSGVQPCCHAPNEREAAMPARACSSVNSIRRQLPSIWHDASWRCGGAPRPSPAATADTAQHGDNDRGAPGVPATPSSRAGARRAALAAIPCGCVRGHHERACRAPENRRTGAFGWKPATERREFGWRAKARI